jgi:hypothetical protein
MDNVKADAASFHVRMHPLEHGEELMVLGGNKLKRQKGKRRQSSQEVSFYLAPATTRVPAPCWRRSWLSICPRPIIKKIISFFKQNQVKFNTL